MLSTAPPILGITKDDENSKLGIYKVYDFTKGRADIIDRRMGFYNCKPKSRKWTITVFGYVMLLRKFVYNIALHKKYDPCKQNSFEYCCTLLYQLVKLFIQPRSLNRLTTPVRQRIKFVKGK